MRFCLWNGAKIIQYWHWTHHIDITVLLSMAIVKWSDLFEWEKHSIRLVAKAESGSECLSSFFLLPVTHGMVWASMFHCIFACFFNIIGKVFSAFSYALSNYKLFYNYIAVFAHGYTKSWVFFVAPYVTTIVYNLFGTASNSLWFPFLLFRIKRWKRKRDEAAETYSIFSLNSWRNKNVAIGIQIV